jgi:UV DNA damage endonuclease
MAIGYACMTVGVPDTGISRCILKNAEEAKLRSVITSNLQALESIIDYNISNGIKLFRISSDIIPFASHPVNSIPWWSDYKEEFHKLGMKIKTSGMRVSMHPGQYTILNSPDAGVSERAVKDLIYHDRLLTALGMDSSCKLVLHIGGIYGEKEKAVQTFLYNYRNLSREIKDRLILENDDRSYTIRDVLAISELTGAPVVYDNLHHKVNPPGEEYPDAYWIRESAKTWGKRDGKQKLHYSQQKQEGAAGAHSDTIGLAEFLNYYSGLPDQEADIMLEVKDKNLSAVKCINGILNRTAKDLETEWARYKYYILSKSAKAYQDIRQLLKNKDEIVVKDFYRMIEEANALPQNTGAEVNAAQHVWGYISESAASAERKRYEKLLEAYQKEGGDIQSLKNHLLKCARERGIKYLEQSLYFYIS